LHPVIFLSGATGFIGTNLVKHLRKKYKSVVCILREGSLIHYSSAGCQELINLEALDTNQKTAPFVHLATYYNPNPNSFQELAALFEANVAFPMHIIENQFKNWRLKIIYTGSYHQLLPLSFANEYSLTKELFRLYIQKQKCELTTVYLFDTYGPNDARNKVTDLFVKRVISKTPIEIPEKDIEINLSYIDDVCRALCSVIDKAPGNYSIFSKDTLTLETLALKIMKIFGSKTEIKREIDAPNLYGELIDIPTNIFLDEGSMDLDKGLELKINEINRTKITQKCF